MTIFNNIKTLKTPFYRNLYFLMAEKSKYGSSWTELLKAEGN
jgi:hypothetical protein